MSPIDSSELYGTADPLAPAPTATAQVATFRVPIGQPPDAPLQPPFAAASVALDNATGRWWRVAGRWVPPWTIGGVVPVDPPSSQLAVEAVTPAGQVSEAAGDELVIVAHSIAYPPSAGIYRPPAVALDYRSAQLLISVSEAGIGSQPLINSPGPDLRIVVVAVGAAAEASGLRGLVRVSLDENVPPFGRRYVVTLAPDAPMHAAAVHAGALRFPAGGGVDVTHEAQAGCGLVGVSVHADYYIEPAA